MGTDPARPDALTLTLAPRVARSLARFYGASAFNQDLSGWVVNNVNGRYACLSFCWRAGFTPTSTIPSFTNPESCGKGKSAFLVLRQATSCGTTGCSCPDFPKTRGDVW